MDTQTIFTERELYTIYDEMLDECYGVVSVAGMHYDTSRILQEIDPIAYRCGFNDWLDAEGYDEQPDGTYTQG